LSALLGITTDEAMARLELCGPSRHPEYTQPLDIIRVLEDVGWRVERYKLFDPASRPTLLWAVTDWMSDGGAYLAVTPTHFVACGGGKVACSKNREPSEVTVKHPASRWPVVAIWKVIPPGSE
jgi:hypothetical protein